MDKSEIGRAMQALRKSRLGGRPAIMKRCPKCGGTFNTRDVRKTCPAHGRSV